jgi:archaellum component FlaG (FlaF/FlaG flagellin family)
MDTKDKFEELKEKSAELKREAESDYNAATGRLSEDSPEGFVPNIDSDGTYTENKMADEDLGDKVDNLKDKAKDKFEDAKDKVDDMVGDPSENRDPSGYYSENIQGMRGQAGYDKNDWNDSSATLGMNDTSNRFEDLNTDTEAKLDDIEKTVRVGPQDGDSVGMESDTYIDEKSSVPFEPYGEERYEDLSHKSKEVMDKMKDVKDTVADKITTAADTVMNKVRPETPYYEKELVEYEVIIHNGGKDDYFFNPLLIQKYDVKKKNVDIKPFHKKGTTLESKVIQPGETYTATLMVEKEIGKSEGLVVFEDVMMDNASLILLKDSTTDVDEFEQELFGYTDEDDIE